MSAKARKKVRDLIELACAEGNEDAERRVAAMRAVKIIRKYGLLSSPLDGLLSSDNETVQAASTLLDAITDPRIVGSAKKIADRFRRRR